MFPVGGAPGDQAAGEVEHGEVGVGAFFPAGEDAAEAIQPGVGAFDDPAAGAEAGFAFELCRFLAARADVCAEAELVREFVHLWVVVALVEAEVLRGRGRRLGPFDRDRFERRAAELEVVAVGAVSRESERYASAFCEQVSLRPAFGSVGRVGAGLFAPEGGIS